MFAQAGEPGNTHLDSFPRDWLHIICAQLPRASSDVQNFRLTCMTFAEVGTDYLLRYFRTVFKRTHFDRLVEMSHHPAARVFGVIHYQGARLPQKNTFRTWKAHADIAGYGKRKRRKGKKGDEAYTRYSYYHDDEQRMIQEDKDWESFKTSFENCPNITSIAVALGRSDSPTGNMYRLGGRNALIRPWEDESKRCGVRQLSSVLFAAEHAGTNLRYLYAGSISVLLLFSQSALATFKQYSSRSRRDHSIPHDS